MQDQLYMYSGRICGVIIIITAIEISFQSLRSSTQEFKLLPIHPYAKSQAEHSCF